VDADTATYRELDSDEAEARIEELELE